MKKKIIGIIICTLMIATSVLPVAGIIKDINTLPLAGSEIDQKQEIETGFKQIMYGGMAWQEFKPEMNNLVQLDVNIAQSCDDCPKLKIEIVDGAIALFTETLAANEIPYGPPCNWITISVPKIDLVIGNIYEIQLSYTGGAEYYWAGATGNPYINGTSSVGSQWDFCFRTWAEETKGDIVIDQSQEEDDGSSYFIESGALAWQEFIPSKKKLVSVEVKIYQNSVNQPDLTLEIHRPYGTVLTSASLPANSIPSGIGDWTSFNVPNVTLEPKKIYFIVLRYDGDATWEYYWCGSNENPYSSGHSSIGGYWDFCFRTHIEKSKARNFCDTYNDLSDKLIATRSKSKALSTNLFFLRFLEKHPHLLPILRQLLVLQ